MILLVSTTIRGVPAKEKSGYVYSIDFENQKILKRSQIIEPPHREVDANPRGGMRGSKGIAINQDQIAIANTSSIFLYDLEWNLIREISHPSCAGIHDIMFQGDTIWATAARSDMIFQFDFEGNLLDYFYFREPDSIRQDLSWRPPLKLDADQVLSGKIDFRDPLTYEIETYDNAHVNSICQLRDGDFLVSLGLVLDSGFLNLLRIKSWFRKRGLWNRALDLNRKLRGFLGLGKMMHSDLIFQPARGRSAIVRLSKERTTKVILKLEQKLVPGHSLITLPNGYVVYLDTTEGKIIEFDPDSGNMIESTKVTEGFLRGVTLVPENKLVLGSDGDLLVFDRVKGCLLSTMQITDIPRESVFGIENLPSNYELPPKFLGNTTFGG